MAFVLLIVLVLLQLADWHTTRSVLELGGRELNPAMRWLIERMGTDAGLLAGKTVLVFLPALALVAFTDLVWPLAILCLGYGYVVLRNWRVLRHMKGGGQ